MHPDPFPLQCIATLNLRGFVKIKLGLNWNVYLGFRSRPIKCYKQFANIYYRNLSKQLPGKLKLQSAQVTLNSGKIKLLFVELKPEI